MERADRASGLFWFVFSLFITYESYKLGLGILHQPGAGLSFFLDRHRRRNPVPYCFCKVIQKTARGRGKRIHPYKVECYQDHSCFNLPLPLCLAYGKARVSYFNPALFHSSLGSSREKEVVVCGLGEPNRYNSNLSRF